MVRKQISKIHKVRSIILKSISPYKNPHWSSLVKGVTGLPNNFSLLFKGMFAYKMIIKRLVRKTT